MAVLIDFSSSKASLVGGACSSNWNDKRSKKHRTETSIHSLRQRVIGIEESRKIEPMPAALHAGQRFVGFPRVPTRPPKPPLPLQGSIRAPLQTLATALNDCRRGAADSFLFSALRREQETKILA
jgi:hypothetical protein